MNSNVWVIDDDRSIRWVLERALKKAELGVKLFESADNALRALEGETPQVIITDVRMPGMDGFQFLEKVQTDYPQLPVIVMTAHSDLDNAVSAYQGGAFEYLPKPFDVEELPTLADSLGGGIGMDNRYTFAMVRDLVMYDPVSARRCANVIVLDHSSVFLNLYTLGLWLFLEKFLNKR